MLFSIIRNVNHQLKIILYPIIFDVIALMIGIYLVGFHGEPFFSINLILEMGIPTVSDISSISIFANQMTILNELESVHVLAVAIVISLILIRAFLQGGYIHFLASIIKDDNFYFKKFIYFGKKYWLQFTILEFMVYLLKISLAAFFIIFFPNIGSITALFSMVVLRTIFIYLEFTIVEDRVNIPTALKLSRRYFFQSFFPTTTLVIIMYILSATLSYLLHQHWSFILIICMIVIYSYLMTLIQALFMSVFKKLTSNVSEN